MRGDPLDAIRLASVVLCLSLAACGGGGGGSDGSGPGSAGPSPPAATFSPSSLSETYGAGESIEFSVKATINTPITGTVYVYIIDSTGVITPNVNITANHDGTYTAVIATDPALTVGHHQGNLELRLCRDSGCTSQYPGSPTLLPYDLNVINGTNLTSLTRWTNVNDWETYQGNSAHTAYVPVTLDAANFTPRWSWVAPDTGNIQPVVAANGTVFVVSNYVVTSYPGYPGSDLYALAEGNMSTQWMTSLGIGARTNPPAVSSGKVFATATGNSSNTDYMWSFDASTGAQLSKTAFFSQALDFYAPVIDSGTVYTEGGYGSGVNAFNFADGSAKWFVDLTQWCYKWSPAVDASYVYAYVGDSAGAGLNVIDKSTGTLAFRINDPSFNNKGYLQGAPVVASNNSVIMVNGRSYGYVTSPVVMNASLVSFNVASRTINWSVTASYFGNPALANGVIYTTNHYPFRLEARDESTGTLLWSWKPTGSDETNFYGDLVVTDNMVFVSTNRHVYAISLSTHQPVWSYWRAGNLAISANGVLYIAARSGGRLGAVNLK